MKVVIVAEYYPRAADPTLGIWAHHQARAARDAGADVRVIVLHRPLPPLSALRGLRPGSRRAARPRRARRAARIPAVARVDARRDLGPLSALSVPAAGRELRELGRVGRAAAAPRAAPDARRSSRSTSSTPTTRSRRATPSAEPRRTSRWWSRSTAATCSGAHADAPTVRATFAHARLVLANSAGTARRCHDRGARAVQVVHLGADPPRGARAAPGDPDARHGRQPDRAQTHRRRDPRRWRCWPSAWPQLRYVVVGDGPERGRAAGAGGVARRRRPGHVPGPARARRRGREPPAGRRCSCCRASTRRSASPMSRRWRPAYRRSAAAARTVPRRSPPPAAGSSWSPAVTRAALAAAIDAPAVGSARGWQRMRVAARETVLRLVHVGAMRPSRRSPPTRRPCVADRPGSEPYDPDNLLDRRSSRDDARASLRADAGAASASCVDRRLGLSGGRVLSVGAGWHPGRHLFPAPAFELVAADADPAKVAGAARDRPRRRGGRRLRGTARPGARGSFDVVLYRLVLHHIAYKEPLAPVLRRGGVAAGAGRRARRDRARAVASGRRWRSRVANRTGLATRVHGTPDDVPLSPRRLRATRLARPASQPELHAVTYAWRRLPPAAQRALGALDRPLGSRPRVGARSATR